MGGSGIDVPITANYSLRHSRMFLSGIQPVAQRLNRFVGWVKPNPINLSEMFL
jgi:hypothetical protein